MFPSINPSPRFIMNVETGFPSGINSVPANNPYTPVSYTHLDVYKRQDKGEKPVSGTPSKLLLPMFVVLLVVFVLIVILLKTYTDSTVPWWDRLTTSLSSIAMWMLAHKYVEQWLVWLFVDIVSCGCLLYTSRCV